MQWERPFIEILACSKNWKTHGHHGYNMDSLLAFFIIEINDLDLYNILKYFPKKKKNILKQKPTTLLTYINTSIYTLTFRL